MLDFSKKFTIHGTKVRLLSKKSTFQVSKVDHLAKSKCQVVEFFAYQKSDFLGRQKCGTACNSRFEEDARGGGKGHKVDEIHPTLAQQSFVIMQIQNVSGQFVR